MSKKILVETYILNYAPKDLPWYKIEGLMAYIVQLKHEKFEKNFENTEIINFDKINHCCGGDPLQNSEKYYKRITKKEL